MLYEIKDHGKAPVICINGTKVQGTGVTTVQQLRAWFGNFLTEDQLDNLIGGFEASGYGRLETKPVPEAKLKTEFDTPEQEATYARGVAAVLAALSKGR